MEEEIQDGVAMVEEPTVDGDLVFPNTVDPTFPVEEESTATEETVAEETVAEEVETTVEEKAEE